MSEDAWFERRTGAAFALAQRISNYGTGTRQDLIHEVYGPNFAGTLPYYKRLKEYRRDLFVVQLTIRG